MLRRDAPAVVWDAGASSARGGPERVTVWGVGRRVPLLKGQVRACGKAALGDYQSWRIARRCASCRCPGWCGALQPLGEHETGLREIPRRSFLASLGMTVPE
jgi:hypothetical protein